MQHFAGFIGGWELVLMLFFLLFGLIVWRVVKFIRRKPPQP